MKIPYKFGMCLCGRNESCGYCDGSSSAAEQEAFRYVAVKLVELHEKATSQDGRTEAYEVLEQGVRDLIADLRSGK